MPAPDVATFIEQAFGIILPPWQRAVLAWCVEQRRGGEPAGGSSTSTELTAAAGDRYGDASRPAAG